MSKIRHRALIGFVVAAMVAVLLPGAPVASVGHDFTLTILHHNDGESQLLNAGTGIEDFGGVARFKTLADQLKMAADPTGTDSSAGYIMITAGDNFLAGPELSASLAGTTFYDALALGAIGYDAMVIGNHDFDFGPDLFERFVTAVNAASAGTVPFLSSNLDFGGEPGLVALGGLIAKSTIITEDGRQIGVIGATTENLPFISSPRNVMVGAVTTAVQAEIDALTAAGVDIIILSAHLQGLEEDIALISGLSGLDVAVAGGGDELLSNAGDLLVPGDSPDGRPYPVLATDADGNTVPLVTSAGDYKYIGRLVVEFDAAGNVVSSSGGPVRVSGVAPDAVAEDPGVLATVATPVADYVADLASNVIATSEVALNGVRNPGIRTQETNEGNLVADSFRWQADQLLEAFGLGSLGNVDVALANGGGIRNNNIIPAGDITELTTFDILPFPNFLTVFEEVPRDTFKAILENAVSRVEFVDGRFAHLSGMSMVFDPLAPAGSRVLEAALDDGTPIVSDGVVVTGDAVSVVTVDFLARGGDQYPFGSLPFTVLGTSYQRALFNYIIAPAADGGLEGLISAADYPEGGEGRITQALRINEFVANHDGADSDEFVEIVGIPDRAYDDYTVLVVEGDGTGTSRGRIDRAYHVGTTNSDGYWTTGFLAGELENGTQTLLLVQQFTGAVGDDIDGDDDGAIDFAPWAMLVDDVAVADGGDSDLAYSSTVLTRTFDGGIFTVGGASRIPDATDTDTAADWVRNSFGGDGLPSFPLAVAAFGEAFNTPGAENAVQDLEAPFLKIYEIQGASHLSEYAGMEVITQGVVTAVGFDGYYVQDPFGDGDDATSDGMFVRRFGDKPAVGSCVELTDTVEEFNFGSDLSTTRMNFPDEVLIDPCPAGWVIPDPVVIGLSGRIAPNEVVISDDELPTNLLDPVLDAANEFDPENDGIDFYESLEGMLVTVEAPQAVSAIRQFGTFSAEFFVVPNGADPAIIEPDDAMTSRGGIEIQADPDGYGDLNPERVQIQLSGSPLYPGPMFPPDGVKVGDMLGDVTGVVGYSFGNFEIHATEPLSITDGGLGPETTSLQGTNKLVTVGSYNVLNLSARTAPMEDDDDAQRALLAHQIVNALNSPDVLAIQEIQDNNGSNGENELPDEAMDGVTDATMTLQMLVDEIAAAGGPTYAFFDVPPAEGTSGGVPGGNLRNAFLYNPERVKLIDYMSLTEDALTDMGVAEPAAFAGTRDPLMATFKFRGREFTVINNHLTSRFGSEPIFGGPQPFFQAGEVERAAQVGALNEVVDMLIAANVSKAESSKTARVMVVGDLNTFQFTDELADILPGPEGVLSNLVDTVTTDDVYTFIFDGNSQALDHFFVTNNLLDGAEFDIVHLNVDFPRRFVDTTASDHEPLVALFDLKVTKGNAGTMGTQMR